MERCKIFQISGIKNRDKKRVLVKGIQQLGGKYIGGSVSSVSSSTQCSLFTQCIYKVPIYTVVSGPL